jgi:cytochrome c oxidase subunit 2
MQLCSKKVLVLLQGKAALDTVLITCFYVTRFVVHHYNMQMKIIVDTPEDYKIWLKANKTC